MSNGDDNCIALLFQKGAFTFFYFTKAYSFSAECPGSLVHVFTVNYCKKMTRRLLGRTVPVKTIAQSYFSCCAC